MSAVRPGGPLRRLRVAVVNPYGVLGGAERWLLSLLDATDRLDPVVVLLDDGELAAALSARGIPTEVLPTGPRGRDVLGAVARLRHLLDDLDVEVVLANGVKAAAAAVPAARWSGLPVVWAKHDFSFDARLAPVLGRLADAVVANSAAVAEATGRADAVLVPPPRPAPPLPAREAEARLRALGIPPRAEGALRVACVGRLIAYKGVDTAIAALALPAARRWELVVLGDDDYAAPGERERLRRLADGAGVGDRVFLPGAVPDAGRLLSAVDAVAVLTREEGGRGREGYSIVALEALAAGRPLVGAATSPVVADLAGRAGVVVDPTSSADVAAALATLADSAGPADGAAARGRAEETAAEGAAALAGHPDAAACADRLAQVLATAARRPGAGLRAVPPVSVVTTMRDEAAVVDDLLGAVLAQLRPADEYVVVDDGSTDGTGRLLDAWAERDPRVRPVHLPPSGRSQGRNAGIAAARHEVVAITDAGCRPRPGWLDALRAPFGEPEPPGVVNGVYEVTAEDAQQLAVVVACYPDVGEARRPTPLVRAYAAVLGRAFDAARSDGRSLAVARSAWAEVGGFPEDLRTAEDYAFGRAVLGTGRAGVLAVEAVVDFRPRATLRATAWQYFGYGRGGGEQRAPLLVARDLARAAAAVAAPLLLLRGGRTSRAAVVAGAAAALSLPVARARRRGALGQVWWRLPVVLAVKDLAKAAGCLAGLLTGVPARGRSEAVDRDVYQQ